MQMTENKNLRQAEQSLLKRYAELVNSGAAGNWYQEAELEVISARPLSNTNRANQMSATTEQLKPCPFCGRQVEHVSRACNQSATGKTYIVSCFCGGYSACAHQQEDTLDEVTQAWNRRAPTGATRAKGQS